MKTIAHLLQRYQKRVLVLLRLFKHILIFLLALFAFVPKTYAICPVCTVAVAGGVGVSRWIGVDDTITGLWIGAALMSLSLWTINWLESRKIKFYGRKILTFVVVYSTVIWPLYIADIMGHPVNTLYGIDKLLLGIITGSTTFILFALLYLYLKKKNNDHAHFPFEKIVLVVAPLIVLSAIMYTITK